MKRLKKVLNEFLQPENDPERLVETPKPITEKLTKLREDFSLSHALKQSDGNQSVQDQLDQMSVHVDDLVK